MDYTKLPRKLVYRDRHFLSEFRVYGHTVNSIQYDRMQELSFFRDLFNKEDYALSCFNNALYICTLIEKDDNPKSHLRTYRTIAYGKNRWKYSDDTCAVTMGLVYNLLNTCECHINPAANELPEIIKKCFHENSWEHNGARHSFNNMVERIEFNGQKVSHWDFAPRHIGEVINSGDSLKECLHLDADFLIEAVCSLCEGTPLRLQLIERLLEPEKDRYGFSDLKVCEAHRALHELKAELKGDSFPRRMPFDVDEFRIPSFSSSKTVTADATDQQKYQQNQIADLRQELTRSKRIIKELKEKIEEITKETKGFTAHQSAILVTAICRELNQIPTQREALAPLLQDIWGFSESTSKKALREAFTSKQVEDLAKKFDNITPKIARLLRELPSKIEEENDQRLRDLNK